MDENVDTDYMDTNDLTQAHAHAGLHSCISTYLYGWDIVPLYKLFVMHKN